MNTKKEIESVINNYYNNLNKNAHLKADKYLDLARKDENFNKNYLQIKNLNYNIARLNFENKPSDKEQKQLKELKQKQLSILKKLGINPKQLTPIYKCNLCNDSGFVNGKRCKCYTKLLCAGLLHSSGLNLSELKTLNDFDITITKDKQQQQKLKLLKTTLEDFIKAFPNNKLKNLYLCGPTGVGKTFALECLTSEIIKKGFFVNYLTAFQLNNQFLNYHGSFDKDKLLILDNLIEPDLLVIDDLGSEPLFNNITSEYLGLILSERSIKNKGTLISSNCTPSDIFDRYGERVFSRMFNKSLTKAIMLDGKDLRITKK